jgi:hypothetical protein
VHAVHLALEAEVLAPGGLAIDGGALLHGADRAADRVGLCEHVESGHGRGTRVWPRERGEDLHRGGLAGAVWPEQPEHGALGHREAQAVERPDAAGIGLDKAVCLDCVIHVRFLCGAGYT